MKFGMYYNKETIGDVLLVIYKSDVIPAYIKQRNDIVALFAKDNEIVGYNFLNISNSMKIKAHGQIPICSHQVIDILNCMLKNASFPLLDYLDESGFKVGKIVEMEEHPDSDHLHILKVDIKKDRLLNIVCGSFNAKVGLKVVVATENCFMSSGKQIIPGEVMGVFSEGMLCSGRELNIDGYENKKGLYILDDSYNVGDDFYTLY
ncbi:MAG: DUF4479 domain-containing protein [Candidatus Onthovivens sp.]|nr:DUF4479 domain-containing protein [Candidatus Onthovivens sp.]